MDLLYGHNEAVAAWVAAHIPGCERGFDKAVAIGVVENERLIGGVVYHDYNPEVGIIEISAASTTRKWLNKRTLFAIFSYPFNELGLQMVVMRTAVDNRQENGRGMARLSRAYGFYQIPIPRLYGRESDGILHCLTEENWRSNGFH